MKWVITNKAVYIRRKLMWFSLVGISLLFFGDISYAGDLDLAWDASESIGVGGYKLYYGQNSKNYTSDIDVGNTTHYKIIGLTNEVTYYFALKAYNTTRSIESSYSNEVSATISEPSAIPLLPADFTASTITGSAPLSITLTPVMTTSSSAWRWDFPGSSTPVIVNSTEKAQTVTYSTPGTYTIGMTVYGGGGNVNITKKITVASPTPAQAKEQTQQVFLPRQSSVAKQIQAPLPDQANFPVPVAAYGFEENSGKFVKDSSGRGNHGIIKQARRVKTGRYGKALNFDGVNDWVTINNSESLNLSSGFTLEAWVKPKTIRRSCVIAKQQAKGTVYDLFAYEDRDLPISSLNDGFDYSIVTGQNQLPIKRWVHLASTFDGINQRLFVNGVEVGAAQAQNGLVTQSNGVLRIGGNSIWGDFFQGLIDEVRIYDRALTTEEIKRDSITAIGKH